MNWDTGRPQESLALRAVEERGADFDSVIMLSPFTWDGPWHTLHYFATHLSAKLPVVYVEPSPSWDPRVPGFKVGPLLRGRRVVAPSDRLYVVRPRRLPLERFSSIQQASERSYLDLVRDVSDTYGLHRPLCWATYYDGVVRHLQLLGARPYVYHCLDYFDHPEEARLAEEAQVVLTVSRPLKERQRTRNPRAYFVPNGVAMDWLTPAVNAPRPVAVRRKTVGFVGTLNRNVDFELLLATARRLPDVTLRIVGSVVSKLTQAQQEALETLKGLPNVQMLGFRPPRELFGHIAKFDVCLLPFLDNEWISHSDPIKFYQYLALGKPVVTTPVPAARRYRALCYVAASPAAFAASIDAALGESHDHFERRQRVAATHDWKRLVRRAYKLVGTSMREPSRRTV